MVQLVKGGLVLASVMLGCWDGAVSEGGTSACQCNAGMLGWCSS